MQDIERAAASWAFRRMTSRTLASLFALVLALHACTALAAPQPPLVLDASQTSNVDVERLRVAIERETARQVVLAPAVVTGGLPLVVSTHDGELQIVFDACHIKRTVALEVGQDAQIRQMALLIGNITRNEADEFLVGRPRAKDLAKPATSASPKRKERNLTILAGISTVSTWSIRVSVEGKLGRKVGLAGRADLVGFMALGRRDGAIDSGEGGLASLSPRYYLLGTFEHGLQVGAGLVAGVGEFKPLLIFSSFTEPYRSVRGFGGIMPFIGYKYAAPIGFTFEIQLGVAAVGTDVSLNTWVTGSFGFGWSF